LDATTTYHPLFIQDKKVNLTKKKYYVQSLRRHDEDDYENGSVAVPRIGSEAPDFKAKALKPDKTFADISLSDYLGKWVVLFFYPLDFTFVCPTEIIAFSDAAEKFRQIDVEVIGASVDSHHTHLAWVNTPRKHGGIGHVNIPLIADLTKDVSYRYGALYQDTGHTLRALYIIDPTGILRHITMNAPPVGRNVEEVERLVKAFQHTDLHGEVCPIGWKTGDRTIIPDHDKALEYFKKSKGGIIRIQRRSF